MQKKYLIPVILAVAVIVMWLFVKNAGTEGIELLTKPVQGEFIVDVFTTGELRAKNSTEIRGPQGGRDVRLFNLKIQTIVPEGTIVKKGDFVAELDRSEITAKLQDAQLELQQAESKVTQARLDSTLELSQARDNLINLEYALEERQLVVDQSQYESPAVQRQAEIDLDKAKRQLAQETKNYQTKVSQNIAKMSDVETELTKKKNEYNKVLSLMNEFTVYAPDQGMVIYRRDYNGNKIAEGGDVSAFNPIVAELPDFTTMESITYVNEVDIQKVKRGQNVEIGLDAVPDKSLNGVVTSVANIGEQKKNSDSKVFEVVVEIAGSDSLLRPAMTTSNRIVIDRVKDALYIPLETVYGLDSLNFVYKKSGLSPALQQVELGLMNENEAIVQRGLTTGDLIYLSLPADTTNVPRIYLQEELTSNK